MKVAPEILQALREAATDGSRLALAGPRMESKFYQQVNEVLEAVGGCWTSRAQAHVFPLDAAQAIAPVLATGEVVTLREKRQQAQYFPTPAPVVQRLIRLAELEPGMEVLEPSAGSGAIASGVAAAGAVVDCIERDPGYAAALADAGIARSVQVADFLTVPAERRYDRVIMNPPFTQGADMRHIEHALRFLNPDGLLVSVMSNVITDDDSRTCAFRHLVEDRGGRVEVAPKRAFAKSGTTVSTVLVVIPAVRSADAEPTIWPVRNVESPVVDETADPTEIARQIVADLRRATRAFEAVAKSLQQPASKSVTAAPPDGQLDFDGLDEVA